MNGLATLAALCTAGGALAVTASPVRFEANKGQSAREVEFIGRAKGAQVFFSRNSFLIRAGLGSARIEFAGTSPQSSWEPAGDMVGRIRYQLPERAVPELTQTSQLLRRHVYAGVDALFYGRDGDLEFDFLVQPGADVRRIQLEIGLADEVELDAGGSLRITSQGRVFLQQAPYAYQTDAGGVRREVKCRYRLARAASGAYRLSIEAGSYDPKRLLVIDPVITNANLLGGADVDEVVAAGQSWIVGNTRSIDWPSASDGRLDLDIFIAYLGLGSSNYTLVIGGSGVDRARAAAEDRGWLAIAGETNSPDLFARNIAGQRPVGRRAQPEFGGGETDGFVMLLAYSSTFVPRFGTYLGGTGMDRLNCVALEFDADPANPPRVVAAGTTNSRDLPVPGGFQADFGGGNSDGFWAAYLATGQLVSSSYYGGPGDDTILAAQADTTALWLGGSTSDPLWLGGENSSGEQAFLARAARMPERWDAPVARALPYASRITALRAWQQEVYAAGVTSSREVPTTPESTQRDYGGGVSDAFAGRWGADLAAPRWITYLGGSGADEALALDVSVDGLAVAGWTDSRDLPLLNAPQLVPGGQQDGWAAAWRDGGALAWSTYIGGAGNDRVQAVRLDEQLEARLAGVTSSPDLLERALPAGSDLLFDQRDLRGLSDGFVLALGAELFVSDVTGMRGVSVNATPPWQVRQRQTEGQAEVADASVAEWVVRGEAAGHSVRFITGNSSAIAIRCLVENGETELRYRVDGKSAVARLFCRPAELELGLPDTISSFTTTLAPHLRLGPRHPRTGQLVAVSQRLPEGVTTLTSLTPDLVEVTNSGGFSAFGTTGFANLTVRRTGEAVFQLNVPGWEPVRKTVTIRPPRLTLEGGSLGKDLQMRYRLRFENPTPPGLTHQLVFRSSDPSRVLFNGSAALSAQFAPGNFFVDFSAQALASEGTVQLEVESTVAGTLQFPIALFPIALRWEVFGQPSPLPVEPGGTANIQVSLVPGDPDFVPAVDQQIRLRPGVSALEIPVTSSAPEIAEPGEARLVFTSEVVTRTLAIRGRSAGTATLTFAPAGGVVVMPSASLPVRVGPRGVQVGADGNRFIVGAHLQQRLFVASASSPVTLTSLDPGRLLLSLAPNQPGQPSIIASNNASVYAQALAGDGEVRIRATSTGSEPSETVLLLYPSALVFPESARGPTFVGFELAARSWVLDPATRAPLFAQSLSPSATQRVVDFELSRRDIFYPTPQQLSLPQPFGADSYYRLSETPINAGDVTVTLVQPPGFTTPAYGNRMRVRIEPYRLPDLQTGSLWTAEGFEQAWVYSPFALPTAVRLTFTSSNPDLLRISTRSGELGGAAASSLGGGPGYLVYLQSQRGAGVVDVTVSGEGVESRTFPVEVSALAPEFQTSNAPIRLSAPGGEQTVSVYLRRLLRAGTENSFWMSPSQLPIPTPGTAAAVVRVVSSQPQVVTATPEVLNLAWNTSALVRLRGVGAGSAEVALVSDPARPSPTGADRLRVESGRPGVVITPLTLGFGTVGSWTLRLDTNGAFPAGARISVESRDPARLLLSADPQRPATNRVEINAVQGQSSLNVQLHALAESGTVALDVAIDGVSAGTGQVTLVPTRIQFYSESLQWVSTAGPQKLSLTAAFDQPQGQNVSSTLRVVAGATVRAVSANPAVLRVVNNDPQPIGNFGLPQIELVPVAPGRTTITLETAGGFRAGPPLTVEIVAPGLDSLSLTLPPSLGRDLQAPVSLYASVSAPTNFTLTSNEPSRVLIATAPGVAGAASATLTVNPSPPFDQRPTFWIQSVGGEGPVPLVLTGPGYPARGYALQVVSPAIRLVRPEQGSLGTLSPPAALAVQLGVPRDAGNSWAEQIPRPGISIPVTFNNADPAVGVVTPAQLTLSQSNLSPPLPGSNNALEWRANFEPRTPGTTIVTVSAPAGFQTQISPRQLPINVLASRLRVEPEFYPIRVGFGTSQRMRVSHSFGALAAPLRVTLVSADPARLLLSAFQTSGSQTTPAASIEVTLTGNNAATFAVTGLSAGPAAIRVNAAGTPETVFDVDVLRTGLGLTNINSSPLSVGSSSSLQVRLYMTDPDTGRPQEFSLSDNVRVPVTVSDPTVVRAPDVAVGGFITLQALRTGTATVSITQPPGYQVLPGVLQSIQVTVR